MRRPRAPGQMVHSVSATDLEWERVRERADAAGLSISRYLVERALTVELRRDAKGGSGPPPRLVWSEAEQREMRDRIAEIHDRVSTGSAKEDASQGKAATGREARDVRTGRLHRGSGGGTHGRGGVNGGGLGDAPRAGSTFRPSAREGSRVPLQSPRLPR